MDVRRRTMTALGISIAVVLNAGLVPSVAWGASKPLPASPHPRHRMSEGLLPAWPQLHDHLVVHKKKVRAGQTIHGTLVVMNRGRRSIDLNAGCGVKYTVVLHRPTSPPPTVGFFDTCTGRDFLIRPGRNDLKVQIITTYRGCTETPSQATATHPACTSSGPPPLPLGRYATVLVGTALALPQPRSVTITLSP
jgi:hypothetical protein